MEKIKRREEKARIARQAAIEELQKKREEKKTRNQAIAQQEIVSFLGRILMLIENQTAKYGKCTAEIFI